MRPRSAFELLPHIPPPHHRRGGWCLLRFRRYPRSADAVTSAHAVVACVRGFECAPLAQPVLPAPVARAVLPPSPSPCPPRDRISAFSRFRCRRVVSAARRIHDQDSRRFTLYTARSLPLPVFLTGSASPAGWDLHPPQDRGQPCPLRRLELKEETPCQGSVPVSPGCHGPRQASCGLTCRPSDTGVSHPYPVRSW